MVRLSTAAAAWLLVLGSTGCAAPLAEQHRMAFELAQARDEASVQRARVAELEARLLAVESSVASSRRAEATRDAPVLAKLDHLISVNERLLERTPKTTPPPTATPPEAVEGSSRPPAVENACEEQALPPEEQLERLVRRLHGHATASSWRGGLSLEQSQALRVLLRRERELDASSPWQYW